MQRYHSILLEVWRETGRHLEIRESTANLAKLLAKHLPLEQIIVWRLDLMHAQLLTVAIAPETPLSETRRELAPAELALLLNWYKSGRLLRRGKRLTGTLGLLISARTSSDILVVPLFSHQEPAGALMVTARPDHIFEEAHEELLDTLREPFAVALDNDRRLHEINSLREAAEADRGALLRRLGRTALADVVVGEQTGLRQVMERVDLVSHSDVPVLILGETGTGKELIARAIHTRSPRRTGPFIRVNCGAIPTELIDSQLFGHERGSFTGADQSRPGWFERADGGTLFLDEIGELPLEAQVRFLRVLQDGFVERVGGTHPIHVDVRIVAATHRDLAQMVRENRFREDLWYRLAVFPMLLPPLRERRSDIPDLAYHFAERAATRFGLSFVAPAASDIRLLQAYDWPGNIRELGAVIDRAAILGDGKSLEVSKALGWGEENQSPKSLPQDTPSGLKNKTPHQVMSLDDAMRDHIKNVLALTEGRIEGSRGAAAVLKINPHTLRARMRKLSVDWNRYRSE